MALVVFITALIYAVLVIVINIFIPFINSWLVILVDVGLDIGGLVPLITSVESKLSEVFFGFGISLIVLAFIKKGFETYISWTDGDSDSDPMFLLTLFFKAIACACAFKPIYAIFMDILKKLIADSMTALGGIESGLTLVDQNFELLSLLLLLVYVIIFFIVSFTMIAKGLEIMILRVGFPLACVGLINADKGVFKSYFMTLVKAMLTVTVQIIMMKLGTALAIGWSTSGANQHITIISSIACMVMAMSVPKLLSEFLIPSGQGLSMQSIYHSTQMASTFFRMFKK